MRALDSTAHRSGVLLIAGFVVMIPGVGFAVESQTGSDFVPPTFNTRAGAILLITSLSLTVLGLVGFAAVLRRNGDRVLAILGTVAYLGGSAAWVAATVRALQDHRWTYSLEVAFILAAGCSILLFDAAAIRSGAIPRWVGLLATAWSAGALILFALPTENYPPLLVQLVPLMFGLALVRTARGAGEGVPARDSRA